MGHILSFYEFINERYLAEKKEEDIEKIDDIKDMRERLLNGLKEKKSLKDFVELLNSILKDADSNDNASLWYQAIKQLFDGQKTKGEETEKYTSDLVDVPVSELFPTQSEIDIENSAKWRFKDSLEKYDAIKNIFTEKNFGHNFGCPVLVYNDGKKKWIIDGHHRWSQVALLNPEGGLYCMVVTGKAPVTDFLKLTQGAIASVLAARKEENKDQEVSLPVGEAKPENNIFGDALKGDKLGDKIKKLVEKEGTGDLLVEKLKEQKVKVKNMDDVAKLVIANRDKMIENKQTPKDAPFTPADRPYMPQSDKAGKKGVEKEPVDPKTDGTALNKIAQGEFPSLEK